MNYIPFGPTTADTTVTQKLGKYTYRTPMPIETADRLVTRGHAKNAKESKMRFSTLIKTLQREAMPNMEYPAHGAKWVETKDQYDTPFNEKLFYHPATQFPSHICVFVTEDGRTYVEEVFDKKDFIMTQAIPLAEWWNYQIGGQA